MVNQSALATDPADMPAPPVAPAPVTTSSFEPPRSVPTAVASEPEVISELPAFVSNPGTPVAASVSPEPQVVPAPTAPAPATPLAVVPEPIESDEIDDETVVVRHTGAPAPEFTVEFTTGESFVISGPALVGRNPRPRPGESFDTRIVLTDPTKSVSKTHLEFSVTDGQLYVSDRGSANGTELVRGSTTTELGAGEWTELIPGDVLILGDQSATIS